MGRVLFIRVSAATYAEDDVVKAWPRLCAFAWPTEPGQMDYAFGNTNRGVLALVEALGQRLILADDTAKDALQDLFESLAQLHSKLEAALAERDVATAHALTYELEDTLDKIEKDAYLASLCADK